MGFNNEGAQAAAARLAQLRCSPGGQQLKIGVNIGKNKWTTPEDAAQDYATCAKLLAPYADYLVVNVSSPNTPGLRDLQDVSQLREILLATRAAADQAISDLDANQHQVPLLVKIAPDLSDEDILAVAELVVELGIDGVVAVNTTIAHDEGAGGKSGPLLKERGLDVVKLLRIVLPRDVAIIGCGGISTAEDAREYLAAGANLVQGYTGFIYEGPFWASRINKALTR
jgi:dihydroorotate dehydrogenase